MKTKSFMAKLNRKYPQRYKMEHDFVGLMCGKLPEEINKVLICLDFDEEVMPKVIEEKPDLILTHHPFIYGTLNEVLKNSKSKEAIYNKIMKLGIPVYSMHTNFDNAPDGMNDALAKALNLDNIECFDNVDCIRGGTLKHPMNIVEFSKYCNKQFNVEYSRLINGGKEIVSKIALLGGGGWGYYGFARDAGYDIFVSCDIPHHARRDVLADKFNFLDMPHEIEKIFIPWMHKKINEIDQNIEVIEVDHEKLPALIY